MYDSVRSGQHHRPAGLQPGAYLHSLDAGWATRMQALSSATETGFPAPTPATVLTTLWQVL